MDELNLASLSNSFLIIDAVAEVPVFRINVRYDGAKKIYSGTLTLGFVDRIIRIDSHCMIIISTRVRIYLCYNARLISTSDNRPLSVILPCKLATVGVKFNSMRVLL